MASTNVIMGNRFDENFINSKFHDIDDFLSRLKMINPDDLSDITKSKLHNVYTKCGILSSYWEVNGKNCIITENEIDASLWQDNILLKYLYERYVNYASDKLSSRRYLYCSICEIFFDDKSDYFIKHLNHPKHELRYTQLKNKIQDDLWKNNLTFRNAFQNFIELRSETLCCKICGIILPLTHNDLVRHLNSKEHQNKFRDVVTFKLNRSSSEGDQLIQNNSSSENDTCGKIGVEINHKFVNSSAKLVGNISNDDVCKQHVTDLEVYQGHGTVLSTEKSNTELNIFESSQKNVNDVSGNYSRCLNKSDLRKSSNSVGNEDDSVLKQSSYERENNFGWNTTPKDLDQLNLGMFGDNVCVFKKQLSEKETSQRSRISRAKYTKFMQEIEQWWCESYKYFCEICNCYETNCSLDSIIKHIYSGGHWVVTSGQLKDVRWWYCEFCNALLFCSLNLLAKHYQHPVHVKFITLHGVNNRYGQAQHYNSEMFQENNTRELNLKWVPERQHSNCHLPIMNMYVNVSDDQVSKMSKKLINQCAVSEKLKYYNEVFVCYVCDCIIKKFSIWIEHLLSDGHKKKVSAVTKLFKCDCNFEYFCTLEICNQHLSSINHLNLRSFFAHEFSIDELKKRVQVSLNNEAFIDVDDKILLDWLAVDWKWDENLTDNLSFKLNCVNFSVKVPTSQNYFKLVYDESDECVALRNSSLKSHQKSTNTAFVVDTFVNVKCNNLKTYSAETLCVSRKSKSDVDTFVAKHSEFMEKIELSDNYLKIFCQLCNFFEISSSEIEHIHEHSVSNNKTFWWHCEFCSADLFCSPELMKHHYHHPIHVKIVMKYISEHVGVLVEKEHSESKNISAKRNTSEKEIHKTMKQVVKNLIRKLSPSKKGMKGFCCCHCNYMTSKLKRWNKHISGFDHKGKVQFAFIDKIIDCNCGITFSCSGEFYREHLYSIEHFNLLSYHGQCIRNRDVKESFQKHFESQTASRLFVLDTNIQQNWTQYQGNLFAVKEDKLNDKDRINLVSSFHNDNLKLENKQNSFVSNRKQQSDLFEASVDKQSKLVFKHNSDKPDFIDDITNSLVHNYFMKKICEQLKCFNYFCQLCGCYGVNTSFDAFRNHDSSLEHNKVLSGILVDDDYQWRNCDFCSVAIFCSLKFFAYHFQHSVHIIFVSVNVFNANFTRDGEETTHSDCVEDLLDQTFKEKINTSDTILNPLSKSIFRKFVKKPTRKMKFFCSACAYSAHTSRRWIIHLADNNHKVKVHCSEGYKIVNCDCGIEFFCSDDFYTEHVSSVTHVNLKSFFSEVFGNKSPNVYHSIRLQDNNQIHY